MITDASRTYGLHIYSNLATDYRIEVEREVIRTYENGDTARISNSRVLRTLSQLAEKPVPGGAVTITNYAMLAALISACATQLAEEDAAAQAAVPAIPSVSDP